jgi:dual specificity phosphatase 12
MFAWLKSAWQGGAAAGRAGIASEPSIDARVAALARYDAYENADDPAVGRALRESLSERAHEVRPRLWLGAHAATELSFLEAHGVTHVLNCLDASAVADADVVTLTLDLDDIETQHVPLARATAFIRCALDAGGVVLVHCAAGISRSATCVVAHIVATERCSVEAALASVRAVRAQASPNEGFLAQLCAFEAGARGQTAAAAATQRAADEADFAALEASRGKGRPLPLASVGGAGAAAQ